MRNLIRALIAGWGARRLGGGGCGCLGTLVVFAVLYWLLGYVL